MAHGIYWLKLLHKAWKERSVVWLAGVRRVGKSASNFDPTNLAAFRYQHPEGQNLVLAHDVEHPFHRSYGDLGVRFESLQSFANSISPWELGGDLPRSSKAEQH